MDEKPYAIVERMETELEDAPGHLLDLLNNQINIVWMNEYLESPQKFKHLNIIAIMVFHGKPKITKDLIEKLPTVKLVAVFGAGYNNIDTKMLQSKNIKVSNTPKVLDDACANQAMLLILATAREFTRDVNRTMSKSSEGLLKNRVTMGVDEKTLGIVGMGNIGFAIAKRAKVFNMKIVYHNRNKRYDDNLVEAEYYSVLNEMLPICDYVIVTLSLTPETTHIIDEDQFKVMKKSAAFINVSRGGTVNHSALTAALRQGLIRFAALDVTQPEPLPRDHKLLQMDNVIITGHTSSATLKCRSDMCQKAIDNVLAISRGLPLPSEVPKY